MGVCGGAEGAAFGLVVGGRGGFVFGRGGGVGGDGVDAGFSGLRSGAGFCFFGFDAEADAFVDGAFLGAVAIDGFVCEGPSCCRGLVCYVD